MKKNNPSEWIGFLSGMTFFLLPVGWLHYSDPETLYGGTLMVVIIPVVPLAGGVGFIVGRAFGKRK